MQCCNSTLHIPARKWEKKLRLSPPYQCKYHRFACKSSGFRGGGREQRRQGPDAACAAQGWCRAGGPRQGGAALTSEQTQLCLSGAFKIAPLTFILKYTAYIPWKGQGKLRKWNNKAPFLNLFLKSNNRMGSRINCAATSKTLSHPFFPLLPGAGFFSALSPSGLKLFFALQRPYWNYAVPEVHAHSSLLTYSNPTLPLKPPFLPKSLREQTQMLYWYINGCRGTVALFLPGNKTIQGSSGENPIAGKWL